jgi:hypothetical protein
MYLSVLRVLVTGIQQSISLDWQLIMCKLVTEIQRSIPLNWLWMMRVLFTEARSCTPQKTLQGDLPPKQTFVARGVCRASMGAQTFRYAGCVIS